MRQLASEDIGWMMNQQLILDEDFDRYAEGEGVLERDATAVTVRCTLSVQAEVYVEPVRQLPRYCIKAVSCRLIISRTTE